MKKVFSILLISIFLFNVGNQAFASETSEELSIDDKINEAIGPVTDFIFSYIFYPIPLQAPEFSKLEGELVNRVDLKSGYTKYTIKDDSGEMQYFEVATARRADLKIGEQITEETAITTGLSIPFVVVWLIIGALIFTFYFGFVNVRKFKLAIDIVRGRYTDPNESGEVSHFQALTAALSGTVGLGNIAGVAIAISLGGPGATLWMIIAGLLGMSSKFVECTLGVKYREIDENGTVHGGPMFYLKKGLEKKNMGFFGKILAVFFAVMCIGASFGGGNMFQVNQAYHQFAGLVPGDIDGWIFGVFMAFFVGIVIIGGIKSIAKVTEKIVPFMVGVYVLAAIAIIFMNIGEVPTAFTKIVEGAFDSKAVYGGIIGVLIVGFQRAAFSNEAGIGSASIAHSAVKTENPVSEGLVALLEPFIDTVIVCTMTAIVIIITDNYHYREGIDGVTLTSESFGTVITWFPYVLSLAVILFAFSTMISWSYYGLQSWEFLFGKSKASEISYKALFCVFVVIGAAMSLEKVIDFSDAMIFAMCFPNIIGMYILMPEVKRELSDYLEKISTGKVHKNF